MNEDIKKYAKSKDVRLWRVAEKLGTSDSGFSRRLGMNFQMRKSRKLRKLLMI